MRFIHLKGKSVSLDLIKGKQFLGDTPYEKQTIAFIADWLNGRNDFTIYTSGSTGNPKPIVADRGKMITSALMTGTALKLKAGDTALVCLNTDLIAGKMMLVRGLELGMNLCIYPPSANPLVGINEEVKIDFSAMVPYQVETILKETPDKLPTINAMKALIIGGAAINAFLQNVIQNFTVPTYHTFGMTETISHIALRKLNGKDKSEYYSAMDNVSVDIDNRNCLIINSPFSNEPIITNDVVEVLDHKTFKWLGRIDNIINSGGLKIHPEKIEATIEKKVKSINGKRFFITGGPHQKFGEVVTIIIEDKPWINNKITELKEELISVLSKYEVPKQFYFLETFSETPSGKINRLAMKKLLFLKK